MDVLAARARAVLVPFAAERETEQLLRAEALAARGIAEVVRESELSAAVLACAIERAAARDPIALALDTGGAIRSAQLIAAMIGAARQAGQDFATGASEGMLRQ
jgi:predicted glycosyltransferase